MKAPYTVLRNAVEISDSAYKTVHTRAKRAVPIFNNNEEHGTDRRRAQTAFDRFETTGLIALTASVERALHTAGILGPGTARQTTTDWVVLVSTPGCQQQHMHTDFDRKAMVDVKDDDKPAGVIVGFQPNTKLVVNGKTIVFGRGDVVVFRGDTMHAGAAYDERNVRVHAYVDSQKVIRHRNKTYLAGED